jgi:hypothetical protein
MNFNILDLFFKSNSTSDRLRVRYRTKYHISLEPLEISFETYPFCLLLKHELVDVQIVYI